MKTKVLDLLKKSNDFISGQEICNICEVSRTAVWKHINKLKEEGYVIESHPKKGYKIISYPDILSKNEIETLFLESTFINEIKYYEETDSTNTRAKILAEEGAKSGTLIIANRQLEGKGRRGRSFVSPLEDGIYMTLLLRPEFHPLKASMLTILAALSVRKALISELGLNTAIKWPNDIVVDNKKLSGILTEMNAESDYINYIVLGIGINVNNKEMDASIREIATSVYIETNKEVKRSPIIKRIMEIFEEYYNEFLKNNDLLFIQDEYNEALIHYNKIVKITGIKEEFEGMSLGINKEGNLLVKKDEEILSLFSGEISVRGVNGYV